MAKRYRQNSITIEIEDFIGEIDDEILLEECQSRKLTPAGPGETVDLDIVREAYDALQRHSVAEARSILERLLFPKWKTPKECQIEYFGVKNGP